MSEKNYSTLSRVVTPEIQLDYGDKERRETTFLGVGKYMDADDELLEIAKFIKNNTEHNSEIEPDRVKYLYTTKAKKVGGKFVLGDLVLRSELDKLVNDEFDYILVVYYQVWKTLEIEDKVIQLDKLLCGIKDGGKKKEQVDSREYTANLWHYQPDRVLRSTEKIALSVENIIDKEKEYRSNPPTPEDEQEAMSGDDQIYEVD